MNTEKLSPFEGLRLVANAAKGYIAQQIATIAGTVEGIVTDLNASITKLEGDMPKKLDKVAANKAAELVTAQADGTIAVSGKKIGGATLASTPNQNTVATEQAVKAYVDAKNGLHDMFSQTLKVADWAEQSDGTYTISFTHPLVKDSLKLDVSCDTATFQQFVADGVTCIRIDNNNGTAVAVCIGGKPTVDVTVQITIVKLQANI
ncbi:MAG: hypothetical protein KH509_06265 [Clostridium sp.]|jgi:hypothetical protein|nr:hypothetical protein [Clostridium sp.]